MEVSEEVVLALGTLEVEPINHEVCAVYPLDVLNLLCHACIFAGLPAATLNMASGQPVGLKVSQSVLCKCFSQQW